MHPSTRPATHQGFGLQPALCVKLDGYALCLQVFDKARVALQHNAVPITFEADVANTNIPLWNAASVIASVTTLKLPSTKKTFREICIGRRLLAAGPHYPTDEPTT
jgi:hypothetical protein